jgi:hypothetical protein
MGVAVERKDIQRRPEPVTPEEIRAEIEFLEEHKDGMLKAAVATRIKELKARLEFLEQ